MIGLRTQRCLWALTALATLGAAVSLQACSGKVAEPADCASKASCGGATAADAGKAAGGNAAASGEAPSGEGGTGATISSCQNAVQDADEADVDCGGNSKCDRCTNNSKCKANADCESNFCKSNRCSDPTCTDKIQNQDETGVDCGGACLPCDTGSHCETNSDCASEYCKKGECADHCLSRVQESDETDLDCGGDTCGPCADARKCRTAADCESYLCSAGKCAADLLISHADVIDDFEDGDLSLPANPARAGRVGNWYAFNDGTGTEALDVFAIKRGSSSVLGLRVKSKDFLSWGSGVGADFDNSASGQATKLAYDASAYSAVTFWARAQSPTTLMVALPDVDTDSAGNICSTCGHHYSHSVSVTMNWQRFTISFSDLALDPGGIPAPTAFKPTALLGLQFRLPPSMSYEVSIDDVAFVKK